MKSELTGTENNSKYTSWMLAIRPKTLPAAASPVIVGTAMAIIVGEMKMLAAIGALTAALLLQIASNLANDVFDFKRGVDNGERLGPIRVTQSGLLSEKEVYAGLALVLVLAGLIGIYLTSLGGWIILLIGVFAILAALAYSGGPLPFGYYGLGDLVVFVFFGPVAVCGTYLLQAREIQPVVWLMSIAPGLQITGILVVNNLRDIKNDQLTGKQTLAVRIGSRNTQVEYTICLLGSYLVVLVLVLFGMLPAVVMLILGTIPMAYSLVSQISNFKGRELNQTLAATGRLTLVFSILFFTAMVIGTYIH